MEILSIEDVRFIKAQIKAWKEVKRKKLLNRSSGLGLCQLVGEETNWGVPESYDLYKAMLESIGREMARVRGVTYHKYYSPTLAFVWPTTPEGDERRVAFIDRTIRNLQRKLKPIQPKPETKTKK